MTSEPNNYNHFFSRILKEAIPPEVVFNYEQGTFVPNDPPGTYTVHNMAHYGGMLLSVHFCTDQTHWVEGSAVVVAPGIAIAAAHVVEPYKGGLATIFCCGLTPNGLQIWKVRLVCSVANTDLVLLCLSYSSPTQVQNLFRQAIITTRLPRVGEPIMIAGFRATELEFEIKDGRLYYEGEVRIGVGTVTDRYPNGRNSSLPWPAIQVDCGTKGGMSGGPAFDENGLLVGVLAKSWETRATAHPIRHDQQETPAGYRGLRRGRSHVRSELWSS